MVFGRYEWVSIPIKHIIVAGNTQHSNMQAFAIRDKETQMTHPIDTNVIRTYAQLMTHNHTIINRCIELNRMDVDDELYLEQIMDYTKKYVQPRSWRSIPPF